MNQTSSPSLPSPIVLTVIAGLAILWSAFASPMHAGELKLGSLFTDHMVLQRDKLIIQCGSGHLSLFAAERGNSYPT